MDFTHSIILSAILCVFLPHAAKVAEAGCTPAYGQCGGIGFTGATCCVVAYQCVYFNDHYSQCVPSTTRDPLCLQNIVWSQCGGRAYTGATCCPIGSTCVKQDDYYSQCRPVTEEPSSTLAPITAQQTKLATILKGSTKHTTTTSTKPKTTKKTVSTTTKKPQGSTTTKKPGLTTTKISPKTEAATTKAGGTAMSLYTGVLATEHQAVEVGSCELPEGQYAVNYPFALGDIASLQTYRWRPEMCGHVLRINCNVTSVDIIVTNSNLGGGMDLYKSTWEFATANKPPGQTYCTVQMTSRNSFTSSGYKCFYNDGWSDWYHNVALLNTNERIVIGAKMEDGRTGAHRGGNPYYAFDGFASLNMTVTFQFEDGGTYQVKLSDCASGTSKHIWS